MLQTKIYRKIALFLKWGACLLLLCGFFAQSSFGQNSATPANVYSPLIETSSSPYNNLDYNNSSHFPLSWSNPEDVIGDVGDGASSPGISIGSAWIEVEDNLATNNEIHPSGSYAGFVVDSNLLTLLGGVEITVYNDDETPTVSESFSGGDLLGLSLSGSRAKIGFISPIDFNRIRITFSGIALGSRNVYYAEILSPDNNAAPDLSASCNEPLPWVQAPFDESEDGFPVVIDLERTGTTGISLGDISGLNNIVDSDISNNAASLINAVGVASSVQLSVQTLGEDVPGGTFAGFNVSLDAILSVSLLGDITIHTYLDDNPSPTNTATGDDLVASVGLLGSSDRYTVGFQTENAFDAIQIVLSGGLLELDLSVFNVYHPVVTNFCEIEENLTCYVDTPISTPDYPVFINTENTGVTGLASACLLGDCIQDMENLINGNSNEGAEITPLATSGSASISVKFGAGSYGGSGDDPVFAGFDIENTALLDVDLIDGIEITTYLDGSEQQSSDDFGGPLVEVNTDLLTGDGRRIVGFAATEEFDEVQLSINNVLTAELGVTTVYQLILKQLCPGEPGTCGETVHLTSDSQPVIANSGRSGLICAACSIENIDNLISPDPEEYASINTTAGAVDVPSVSVQNPVDTYPAGTFAGFVIDTGENNLVEADLLSSLEICTYNDGDTDPLECASGPSLLTLTVLLPLIGPDDGIFNVGFETTQDYDTIELRVLDLLDANVLDGSLDIYNAYVDYSTVDGDGTECPDIEISLTVGSCYRTLSSPVAGLTYRDMLDNLWTQGFTGADYTGGDPNVFTWPLDESGETDAGWAPLSDLDDEIPAGSGFLISVFEDDDYEVSGIQGGFDKTISISPGPQNGSILPSSMMNEHPEGWTLAGNPLQSNILLDELDTNDLTGAFYVYDRNHEGGSWRTYSDGSGDITNGAIAVGQGFFVQNVPGEPVEPSIVFTNDSRTGDGQFYGKEKENERKDYMRLEMKGEKASSSAWIRFSEEGSFNQVYGDALQLTPFSSNYAILASEKTDALMDIGHYPFAANEGEVEIPVHAESTIPGTYTITATEMDLPVDMTLYLRDMQTGESVEITDDFEYSFEINPAAAKQPSPDQGTSCSDLREKPTQAKSGTSQPRFVITNSGTNQRTDIPSDYKLEQNYPNPFNPTTNISYQLPQQTDVSLQVFDITGRHIATLVDGTMPAGLHNVNFNASTLSSGVYFYKLQAEGINLTRKFTLIK